MFSDQFMNFHFDCDDPKCASNDEESGYVCEDCQAAWLSCLQEMSIAELYEFYALNQQILDDEGYLAFMVEQLDLDVEDPKAYFNDLNFKFFNNLFFDKLNTD